MLFNSYEFIFLFLPITFFGYYYLLSKSLIAEAKGFLVFASLFFYSWWNIVYLPLILSSMFFNYIVGNNLNSHSQKIVKNKKALLTVGIILNLLLLGYFKYTDFFITNINLLTSSHIALWHTVLPLGISFFTFTQIAYLVDSYKGESKEYSLLNYGLFVTFFPHLLAGPILHHKEMMPQFDKISNLAKNYNNITIGLFLFSIGLFKKIVIADTFAVWAVNGFDTAVTLNFFEAWVTSLSYTFQLYFDFSGYTDMAIGGALLFNIKLPINFNSPYKATDIQDFWRRWHITLSRFLRDYIYIPLGGNKQGRMQTYNNLMITFIVGGLWHGAGWTFVFWGFLHGLALVIHRIWKNLGFSMNIFFAWFITFNFINISWVFFRAKEWNDAIKVISAMFTFEFSQGFSFIEIVSKMDIPFIVLFILVGIFLCFFALNSNQIAELFKPNKKYMFLFILIAFIDLLYVGSIQPKEFLYFDF